MNSSTKIVTFLFVITPCLSYACIENAEQQRIFEYYAKAALFEFCHKSVGRHCTQVNEELNDLNPEFYFFEKGSRKEVLVLFSLTNSHPHVMLSYDKDGFLEVIARGLWFVDKSEMIKSFEKEGEFFSPPDYYG